MTSNSWPTLPLEEWKDTYATLHRLTQIVGKIRLVLTPHRNHWWNTTLYVTPRGLTTSPMPYNDKLLQIDFDFIDHLLLIQTSNGSTQKIFLKPYPVAEFYKEIMTALRSLEMPVTIWTTPVEVPDRTPFDKDSNIRPITLNMLKESGAFLFMQIEYLVSLVLDLLAKLVQYIFSGERLISL